jgi:PAS domain S-box-containing protein
MVAAENAQLYDEMVVTLQKLHESEEITRGMLESAATGVYLVKDGKFQYASPLFEHILGYTSDELIGTVATEYIHPEDREATRKKVIEDLKGRSSSPHEFRLLRKDGRTAWVLEKVASIGYKGKRSTIGSIMDITELKMVQESLQASEGKLRTIFESIVDGITVTDSKGKVVEVNDAALHMGGYTKKELIGKDGFLFVAERDRDRARKEMRQAFREGRSAMLYVVFVTRGGKEYDAEVTLSLMKDMFGKPAGMVGIAKDISQRKQIEEALRSSEEKLRFMFESMGDGVIVTDLEGGIIEANRAALAMAGYSRKEDIVGKSGFDFIAPTELARAIEENESNIKEGRGSTAEYTAVNKDGEEFKAEAIAAMLRDSSGCPQGFIVAVRDITERKRIEQMKTDFVSLISHQLKTPVAGVKAYIENMLGGLAGDLSDKQRQYLVEMRELCVRNYRLISDLLSMSMIERGILSVNIQPITLKQVVDLAIGDYVKSIEEKGLALKIEEANPGVIVLADKDKLTETLRNVIDNALKFTDRGSITIKTEGKGGYGIIEVTDTGTGISDNVMKTLFGKEKVLSGGPKAGGGAKLGLYIAKSFMKLQRGDITATSVVGKGSTFVLKVPMQ